MKNRSLVSVTLAGAIAVMLAGCSQSNKPATPDTTPATNAAATMPPAAPAAATEAAAAATNAAATAVTAMAPAATNAAATTTSSVDNIIAQVKQYIADKKYSDASTALSSLTGMTLTPDQQKIVADLKTQLQQLMAGSAAAGAANSLLGK